MKYVIDSNAWLEYFMGTSKGKKVKSVIDSAEHEKLTPSICVAEVYSKAPKLEGEEQSGREEGIHESQKCIRSPQ